MTAARCAAVLTTAAAAFLVGCSSSSSPGAGHTAVSPRPVHTSPSATSAAAGVDPCVVGTWVSTGVNGQVSSNDGSVTFPLRGGSGEVAVIRSDGTIVLNYAKTAPEQGTGNDGAKYVVSYAGSVIGKLAAANGKARLTFGDPSGVTQVLTRNGAVIDREHPPAHQDSTYTCTPGAKLAVTSAGITETWTKVSGSNASQPPASSDPATTAGAVKAPISDAVQTRDTLLAQADGSVIDSNAFPVAWHVDQASLFAGYGFAADPRTISGGYSFVTSKAKGVDYLAFAVADTAGRCAGGLLVANSASTAVAQVNPVTLPSGGLCRGDAVAQAAGY